MISEQIFSKAVGGAIRYWHYEVEGDKWRGRYGFVGGKDTASGWSTCEGTNTGRANQRTAEQQAVAEAAAEEEKKLDRDYRRTVEELESVPPAVMLARDYAKMKGPLIFNPEAIWSQPKLDGIRLVASKHGGLSREFQPFFAVDHILEALAPTFAAWPEMTLDGELYNHSLKDDFNTISSLVRKKTLTTDERFEVARLVEYHVYDMPSVDAGFADRHRAIQALFAEGDLDLSPIVMVPTIEIKTLEELDEANGAYLADGYEGQMVRLNMPYEFGVRSKALMKRKVFTTEEFPISRIIEGNGNWAGYAKAVEFILPNDRLTSTGERPKAGIRGNQAFTKALLERQPAPSMVTIRYFALTPDGIPRFPVAVDFHHGRRKD